MAGVLHPRRLRIAELRDIPALLALVHRCYRGEASRSGWTTEADLLDGQRTDAELLRQVLVAENERLYVWSAEPTSLAGCYQLTRLDDAAYFGLFAVDPALQAQGYGSAMLAHAEHVTRSELSRETIRLCVLHPRTELLHYYQRRGYRLSGQQQTFPYGDPRFGLPRRPDLHFEVLEKHLPEIIPQLPAV